MKRVLVYGATIFLSGLIVQLQTLHEAVEVIHLQRLEELNELTGFDIMLVDLNDTCSNDVIALLRQRPDLRVIGVNTATGALSVLPGKVYQAHNVEDVIACLIANDNMA